MMVSYIGLAMISLFLFYLIVSYLDIVLLSPGEKKS